MSVSYAVKLKGRFCFNGNACGEHESTCLDVNSQSPFRHELARASASRYAASDGGWAGEGMAALAYVLVGVRRSLTSPPSPRVSAAHGVALCRALRVLSQAPVSVAHILVINLRACVALRSRLDCDTYTCGCRHGLAPLFESAPLEASSLVKGARRSPSRSSRSHAPQEDGERRRCAGLPGSSIATLRAAHAPCSPLRACPSSISGAS